MIFESACSSCSEAGVPAECIWLDPGFGFAKNEQQNVELLKGLDKVCQLGFPVLLVFHENAR